MTLYKISAIHTILLCKNGKTLSRRLNVFLCVHYSIKCQKSYKEQRKNRNKTVTLFRNSKNMNKKPELLKANYTIEKEKALQLGLVQNG